MYGYIQETFQHCAIYFWGERERENKAATTKARKITIMTGKKKKSQSILMAFFMAPVKATATYSRASYLMVSYTFYFSELFEWCIVKPGAKSHIFMR